MCGNVLQENEVANFQKIMTALKKVFRKTFFELFLITL